MIRQSRIERLRLLVNRPSPVSPVVGVLQRDSAKHPTGLRDLADRLRKHMIFGTAVEREEFRDEDITALRTAIAAAVTGRGGEPIARVRAVALGREYLTLDTHGRIVFLEILSTDHGIDSSHVLREADQYREAIKRGEPTPEEPLRRALVAPSTLLLQRFGTIEDGPRFLMTMREHALAALAEHPAISPLERQLREILTTWFTVTFLELRRVTWDSPASLLERLAHYEAVHSIRGWDDLKHRLNADRLVYGFFHPSMPLEPLIFVEVALVRGLAPAIHPLIDETAPPTDPEYADTAIFYSITNAQRGLDGISLGGLLIKQVVDELRHQYSGLRTFSTLSPVPGFRAWLEDEGNLEVTPEEELVLAAEWPDWSMEQIMTGSWVDDPTRAAAIHPALERTMAKYLLSTRSFSGRVNDRVEHFHLSNGARVERINWLGDISERGVSQSLGMMVNYLYKLDEIEENHDAYTGDGLIAANTSIINLANAAAELTATR